ncbi:hypothetical protein [Hydrogenimonas thermophila]|uniref:Sulfotransferase family protein n=1 Tax=Hydrogenimonas thermophila TaxID=223786 RepID=A0A1I5KPT2_9BACT|nr:hypothetical protein [Hydrogenimonas thermophila]SFO87018.1 hypothetical protein SAMN05216234_10127 [Hydrogenimonas thermophila]
MKTIVSITSLERSGSTILDLSLSKHPKMISFGEVWRTLSPGRSIDRVKNMDCNCGHKVKDCEFWSKVFEQIEREKSIKWIERYYIFLEIFYSFYGDDFIPIDSSKFLRAIEKFKLLDDYQVKTIFTIRDVRGWTYSIKLSEKRKKEMPLKLIFDFNEFKWQWKAYIRYNFLRKVPGWLSYEWMYRNRKILKFLEKNNYNYLKISYEELNFNDKVFDKIFNFIGLNNTVLQNSKAHIVDGNRTAFSKDLSLRYDLKWLRDKPINIMLPQVGYFNKKYVWEWD